jgi:nitroreductase
VRPKASAEAAAAFLFVGDKEGYKKLAAMMQPAVAAGALKAEELEKLLAAANASYEANDERQRDEAIRSCCLAATTSMLASQAKGYASGPMIGFDPKGVAQLAGLGPKEVPAILVVVGRAAAGNRPRKPRLPAQVQLSIR